MTCRSRERAIIAIMDHCPHYTRRFIEFPEEPDGRGKAKYECQDCGKTKEMKA